MQIVAINNLVDTSFVSIKFRLKIARNNCKMSDKTLLNEKFAERRQKIADEGKKEYEEIYQRMVSKLNSSHLEPFAKIILEKDGCSFNSASTIESIKATLLSELLEAWNKQFWEPVAVDKLAELEMLKEHFEGYIGTNWNIKTKTPAQRLLPLSMRYKKKLLDFLKSQVEHQSKVIEEKCAQATNRRNFLQHVEEECLQLNESVANQLNQGEQEEKIKEEYSKFLRDDTFAARPKVREEF